MQSSIVTTLLILKNITTLANLSYYFKILLSKYANNALYDDNAECMRN